LSTCRNAFVSVSGVALFGMKLIAPASMQLRIVRLSSVPETTTIIMFGATCFRLPSKLRPSLLFSERSSRQSWIPASLPTTASASAALAASRITTSLPSAASNMRNPARNRA